VADLGNQGFKFTPRDLRRPYSGPRDRLRRV